MRRPEFTLLLAGAMLAAATPLSASRVSPMIDAHAHYTAEDSRAFSPQTIVAKLDTAGVRHLVATLGEDESRESTVEHAIRVIDLTVAHQMQPLSRHPIILETPSWVFTEPRID